jgi:GT2 family glycosyltransferase
MLSIIIPVFNQHEMTLECIQAIRETTQECEIIVIDNCSNPPFKAPFGGFTEIRTIRNEENLGFPAAVNQGIAEAKGKFIVLLNNDVIVTPGWSQRLLSALNEYSIVGPVTNYCAGIQKVATEIYENKDGLNRIAEEWADSYCDHIQEVNFVIGFCMAFSKALFDEIGKFDDGMWPCSGEEVDFCFRARAAGHRVGIVYGCYVHHEGSQTFQDLQDKHELDYKALCKKVDDRLAEKWGADFWNRQEINSSPMPTGLCLNLGCGYNHLPGFINIDSRAVVNPDLVCDVIGGLPYPDNSVDMVRADDFLEHIPIGKVIPVIEEIWRVLKPGGIFESSTPSTDGRGAFQDPTHVSFWNCNSWLYYSDPAYRNLYGIKADFEIECIEDTEPDPQWMIIHTHVIAKKRT